MQKNQLVDFFVRILWISWFEWCTVHYNAAPPIPQKTIRIPVFEFLENKTLDCLSDQRISEHEPSSFYLLKISTILEYKEVIIKGSIVLYVC